ncbi:uncharacterized protein LOC110104029 isoform X2 [Dendrobium catenatum]|uniref:uncharacterized protein LOC110104029 isoform X2 n=1 Tax=Dendrobium catenatum TaxID=906689 RepID=UPI00109F6952|nr:uncharacterized protein LOC110104029 isoform X2 [Dendrobium catenatum]
MSWSHPDISMEELVDRIKGFVDILVLASGYQSSGLPAIWDVDNIKKAVRWGLFFEDVLKSLRLYSNYVESVKELDAALFNLTSDPIFPLGLAHLSSATLSNARRFVLEHLLQTHPIKDEHLIAILRAVVEMDIDELSEAHNDCPKVYIDRLTLQMDSLELAAAGKGLTKADKTSMPEDDPNTSKYLKQIDQNLLTDPIFNDETRGCIGADASFFVIQEILKRQAVMSRMSSIEKGLNSLSEIITRNTVGSEKIRFEWKSVDGASSDGDQILMELEQFSQWRSRCLSYLLDKRTIKLHSGAELIFQAPKEQWIQIFEGLKSSTCPDNFLEIMEILLLGLISSKWNYVIQNLISLPCDFLSIMTKLSDLRELLQRNTPFLFSDKLQLLELDVIIDHSRFFPCCHSTHNLPSIPRDKQQENDILQYLSSLLRSHPHKLWKLPSVLVAAAIPSWSVLFKTHLSDVENHYNESYSAARFHGCDQHGSKHQYFAA